MKRLLLLILPILLSANEYFYDIDNTKIATKTQEKSYCIFYKKQNICDRLTISYNLTNSLTNLPYIVNFDTINSALIKEYKNINIKKDVINRVKDNDTMGAQQYNSFKQRLYALNNNSYVLSLIEDGYTGGAHGFYKKSYYNYSKDGFRINLDNLFIPGYKSRLNNIAYKAYRDYRGLKPNQKLTDDCWFENKFKLAKEFAITPNGLEFYYNSYEVMPYACGQVKFIVPYSKLEPIISNSSVLTEFMLPQNTQRRYFYNKDLAYITLTLKLLGANRVHIEATLDEFDYFDKSWLSISLPQFSSANVISNLRAKNFKTKNVYQRGNKIYNIKKNRAIRAKYLLVEASRDTSTNSSTLSFDLNTNGIKDLKVYLRLTLKNGKDTKSMPSYEGVEGQQGFNNYSLFFRVK